MATRAQGTGYVNRAHEGLAVRGQGIGYASATDRPCEGKGLEGLAARR